MICSDSVVDDESVIEKVLDEGFVREPPVVEPVKPVASVSTRKHPCKSDTKAPPVPAVAGGGITKRTQHTLPKGAVAAAKELIGRSVKPVITTAKVDSSIFKKDPRLSLVDKDQAAFLWEVVMDQQKPQSARKTYGQWRSDHRNHTVRDMDIKVALEVYHNATAGRLN